ncbi:MAG: hypothetical protein ACE15B_25690 [Bryobacteraceae bacterium]
MRRLILLLLSAPAVTAQPARDFPVMAWGSSPSGPELLRGMKDAGLNVSGFCRVDDLERVHAAGLSCFVTDKRVNGYDWSNPPPEDQIRANIAAVKAQVAGNPAALGFYLRDEPAATLMPGLGRVAALVREAMPGMLTYVNLFPYRVSAVRLGTANYDDYVRMLVRTVGQPFLSYDNYSLVNGEMLDSFFVNLEIVRRLALESGVPFWNCILANAHFNYMEPSDATFHLQVYSTLAYGGRGIQYFTYLTPPIGNYRLAPIDPFGNRTATWEMLRRVNLEIHALAPTMLKLRSTGVYHYPEPPPQGQPLSAGTLVEDVKMTQALVKQPAAPRFLIGEFEDERKRPYLMLVNKDLAQSFRFEIALKRPGKLFRTSPYSGKEEPLGREMDWLAPGAGILLRVQ